MNPFKIFSMARKTSPPQRTGGGFFFTRPSKTDVHVNEQSALTFSAVYACIRIISETMGVLPWRLYEQTEERRTLQNTDGLDALLHVAPNEEMAAFTFREILQAHALTHGNGYAEIERTRGGEPVALWPITPDRVRPDRDSRGRIVYEVTSGNGMGNTTLDASAMFHLKGLGFDGVQGYSPIDLARESIAMGLAAQDFGSSIFAGGGIPAGWIEIPSGANLSKDAIGNLKESIEKRAGKGKIWPLDKGMKFHSVSIPPDQAQFLETRKFQINEIARWYRVPPHKLADLERATFSNIEQQSIEFVTDAILPWVIRWEQEANLKLISREDRGRLSTRMNINGLLRGDSKTRGEFYKLMTGIGAYSINRVLELEDENPIGAEGDLRLVPMNMVSVEKAYRDGQTSQSPGTNSNPQALGGVFGDACLRMHRKETKAVSNAARKHDDFKAFAEWATGFYSTHTAQLAEALTPAAEALCQMEGIRPDGDGLQSILTRWATEQKERSITILSASAPLEAVESAEWQSQPENAVVSLCEAVAAFIQRTKNAEI